MNETYWMDDHILSPLGDGTSINFQHVIEGRSGISLHPQREWLNNRPAAMLPYQPKGISIIDGFSRLETLMAHTIQKIIARNHIPQDRKTLLIISSTKGNIGLLENQGARRGLDQTGLTLADTGARLQKHFGFENTPIIVSNACISGALALSVGDEYLRYTDLDQVIVCGGDEISPFIFSGFESFQALSDEPCKPFDKDRKGLNLGEAFAAVLLGKNPTNAKAKLISFGNRNDANHISGPSRTGEGLYQSIQEAMRKSPVDFNPSFISAHGTATMYNDEMESIALERSHLRDRPIHSLKGFYGHTLGTSALIETILGVESLQKGVLIPSQGFDQPGTSIKLNIIRKPTRFEGKSFLKLASGFGGCNIACFIEKSDSDLKTEVK